MENFNEYQFIDDLQNELLQRILNEELTDSSEIWDFIHPELDNQVIYYSDCFDICKKLCFTDFTGHDLGEINGICQAAYCALYDWINDELDYNLIESAIEQKEDFDRFLFSDNCINVEGGKTKTQCTQYRKEFTTVELFEYFLKEYAN